MLLMLSVATCFTIGANKHVNDNNGATQLVTAALTPYFLLQCKYEGTVRKSQPYIND